MSDATSKFDDFKPGETIVCTVTAEPGVPKRMLTIQRLMRRNPGIAKALKNGQLRRRQQPRFATRGGRPWHIREKVGKVAMVKAGAEWSMTYTLDIADDLRSVERFLDVKKA
jgi:hypothetical protein